MKEKELLLHERKFKWEKGEAFVAEQHAKNSQIEAEKKEKVAWRANETSAASRRTEMMAKLDERKTILTALVNNGKSPAEIKKYLAMLEMM